MEEESKSLINKKITRKYCLGVWETEVKLYKWLITFSAGIGGFLFGYETCVINQIFAMHGFTLQFGIQKYDSEGKLVDTDQAADIKGWITFIFLLGCAFGAVIVSYPADYFGRKRSIHIGGFFFLIGGTFQTCASSITMLYPARFVSGFGIGILSAVVPLYISETAETNVRGRLISIYQFMINMGGVIAGCDNSALLIFTKGELQWRLALGLQLGPAVLLLVLVSFLPFSPRWLLYKGDSNAACITLSRLRELPLTDPDLKSEFEEIRTAVEAEREVGNAAWSEIFEKRIFARVSIAVALQFFQQWTGINVISYYGTTLYSMMGFPEAQSSVELVLIGAAISFIPTIASLYLIEKAGRRKLFIVGGFAMGAAHFLVTTFLVLSTHFHSKYYAWGAMVCIYAFSMSFAATWGPTPWVYQSEIFPMRVRAKGTSLATVSNWVWNAAIAKISPLILDSISYYTYVIFGSCCIAMGIFAFVFIPETKGKSLEEIDAIFDRKFHVSVSQEISVN